MKIEKFVLGMIATNCYLVKNEETKEAVLVDPADCPDYMVSHIKSEGYQVAAILLTHGHFDHILGLPGWLREFRVPVYAHEEEKEVLEDPKCNMSIDFGENYGYPNAVYKKDGEMIHAAGLDFKVIYTPGHTKGGCCYYVESALFSGDTLFRRSMGRSDFPTGSESALRNSIKESLFCLPHDTIVYPGHQGETTILEEKRAWCLL